jgi:hypothetical protein
MLLPIDPDLLEVGRDVVVRFKAHGQYGSESAALKALKRRVPESTVEERLAVFQGFCVVYDRAVEGIERHRIKPPQKKGRYAKPGDIDFEACLAEIDEFAPGEALLQKGEILNWVIFWHYLK